MRRMKSQTHSPARLTSSRWAGSALTLGIAISSASSARQASSTGRHPMLRVMRFVEVTLAGPAGLLEFYGESLELPVEDDAIRIGETKLRFAPAEGEPFYHFALLVPGDRFDAALERARERVELLGDVFDFDFWDARAFYFHDPAGNIVELIAHHGLEENARAGAFAAE